MGKRLIIIGAAIFAALFLFSGIMLFSEYQDQKQSARVFKQVTELVEKDFTESEQKKSPFEKYAAVYEKNHDLIGWITIEGTRIDYPVMQTKEKPNFYLKHAFDKSYSRYGVPYIAENCDIDISDNIVIYGHHMNNGSMFSDLCRYADEDFYKAHRTIRFDTLGSFGEYEIISVFKTTVYSEQGFSYYHFVNAGSESTFNEYVSKCTELSLYNTGATAKYGDKLITLSTCEYSRTNGRMVVVAKKICSDSKGRKQNET